MNETNPIRIGLGILVLILIACALYDICKGQVEQGLAFTVVAYVCTYICKD